MTYSSAKLRDELIFDEGVRLQPYTCSLGYTTIGVGRNLDDMGISIAEAEYLLSADINRCHADLDHNVPWWRSMSDARQRSLINMCFNLGWPRLSGFKKMLAAMEAQDYAAASAQAMLSNWADQVGDRACRIAAMIEEG